jgi:hypothetical protein
LFVTPKVPRVLRHRLQGTRRSWRASRCPTRSPRPTWKLRRSRREFHPCGQWTAMWSMASVIFLFPAAADPAGDNGRTLRWSFVPVKTRPDPTITAEERNKFPSWQKPPLAGGRATTQVELLVSNRQQLCPTPTGLPTSSPSVHQVAARCVADEAVLRPFQVLSIYRSIPISPTAARGARHCC